MNDINNANDTINSSHINNGYLEIRIQMEAALEPDDERFMDLCRIMSSMNLDNLHKQNSSRCSALVLSNVILKEYY